MANDGLLADAPDPQPDPPPDPIPFPAPAPVVSPEDERIARGAKRMFARDQEALRQSVAYAARQDPDAYAKDVVVADRLGVQPDFVANGSAELKAPPPPSQGKLDRIAKLHPQMAAWLADPVNASLTHDDLGALRTLDIATRTLANPDLDPSGFLPEGYRFGDDGAIYEKAAPGQSIYVGSFDDLDALLDKRDERQATKEGDLRALYEQGGSSAFLAGVQGSVASSQAALGLASASDQEYAQRVANASQLVDPGFWSGTIARGAGGLVGDLPLMLAGGGFARGAKFGIDAWKLGGQLGRIAAPLRAARTALAGAGKVQTLLRGAIETATAVQPLAIREGITTGQQNGAVNGAISWAIETAVPGAFGKTGTEAALLVSDAERKAKQIAAGDTWQHVARMIAQESGLEGGEEIVTELGHALHERVSGIDPNALDPSRLAHRLGAAGVLGAAMGGGFNIPGEIAGKLSQDAVASDEARSFRERIGSVADAVAANKLTERSPERMAAMVQEQTDDQHDLYQTDEWDQHWEAEGVDPTRAADEMGIRDAYLTAKAHGGEMSVPLAKVVMPSADPAKPKNIKALLDLARQSPGAPNAKAADQMDEQAKAQVAALVKANTPAKAEETAPDGGEIAAQQVAQQMAVAGFSEDDSQRYGQLIGTVWRTLAERTGTTAADIAARFPLEVRREADAGPATEGGTELDHRTPVSDQIRSTNASGLRAGAEAHARGELDKSTLPGDPTPIMGNPILPPEHMVQGRRVVVADVPYGGGTSADGATVYIDRRIPRFLEVDGKQIDVHQMIADHEIAEKARMDRGETYSKAHGEALAIEDADVDHQGISHADYERLLKPYLADAKREAGPGIPGDLETRPYRDMGEESLLLGHLSPATQAYVQSLTPKERALAQSSIAHLRTHPDPGGEVGNIKMGIDAERRAARNGTTLGHGDEGLRRASITFGKDRKFLVRLFDAANASSFLHEAGHMWLEVIGDLAQDANASQQIKDDYMSVLAFLGVQSREQIETKHHEMFARAFEHYLGSGQSPSSGLRRLFARFRAWLLDIYKDLRRLNITLTPEITKVFDRLVATDAEIAAAEHESGVTPLFSTPEQAGKTPEQFAAYRATIERAHNAAVEEVQSKVIARLNQEQEAFYKEERAKVRTEVAADIGAAPVYQAINALQDGLPDGTAPKLSKDGVLEFLGGKPESLALLPGPREGGVARPNAGRRIYTTDPETGIHPDQAAVLFGFDSGDALIKAMLAAPDLETLVEARTDDVMKERYPDPLTDGQLQARAQDAVENEERAKVVQAELKALRALEKAAKPVVAEAGATTKAGRKDLRDAILPLEVYREAAQQIVAKLQVRQINAGQYLVAAGKNAREAFRLANKQSPTAEDYADAANAKQQELLSMELYRAARAALKRAETTRAFLAKFDDVKTRQKIGKAGGWEWTVINPDGTTESATSEQEARKLAINGGGTFEMSSSYLEQIDGLLERFDLRKSFRSQQALARRESLIDWMMRLETNEDGTPSGVFADIPKSVRNQAFTKNWRLLTSGELADLNDAVANIEHLAMTKNALLRLANKRSLSESVDDGVATIEANSRGVRTRDIQPGAFLEKVVDGFGGYMAAHRKMASLARVMDGNVDNGAMWNLFVRPANEAADAEVIENAAATKKLDALYRAWGKKDGPRMAVPELGGARLSLMGKIMVALNWGNAGNRQRLMNHGWSAEQIQAMLETLDEKDLTFVQGVWDQVDGYWSDIRAKMQRINGVAAERVEAIPFAVQASGGKSVAMRGGYFPIAYDPRFNPNQDALDAAGQSALTMRGNSMRIQTARGHEEARVATVLGRKLLLDQSVITRHLNQVIHDLTHHEMLRDASKLLSDKRLAGAMHDHYGPNAAKQFRKTLEDVGSGQRGSENMVDKSLQWLRSGVSIAGIGFNVTSAAMQVTGVGQSMVRVGPKYFTQAVGRIFRDATSLRSSSAYVSEKSAFMRSRDQTQLRELREAIERSGTATARRHFTNAAYFMLTKMQRAVDVPTWLAAYEKATDAGNDDATAVAVADQTIIDTQGSGLTKDLSAVQRSRVLALFTPFYHFLNVQFNLTAESVARLGRQGISGVPRFAADMLLLYTLPAVFGLLIKDLLRGAPEDDEESFGERVAKEHATMLLGSTLLSRELTGIFQSGRDYSGPAGVRGIGSLVGFGKQVAQGELDHGLERASLEVLGTMLRLPTVEMQRIIDAAVSDSQDSQARAAVFGKRPRE